MKKINLIFALLLSLMGVTQMKAEEITVHDGTATNSYLPVYGYYADTKGTISEFIIPSSDLTSLNGSTIEQMTFYLSSPAASSFGNASFNVYLEEVVGSNYDDSSASQLTDNKTLVYAGALDATGATMDIPFTTNYDYKGGNLLIAIEVGTAGTYKAASFYGTTTTSNAGRYKYSSTGRAKFIPKTTFVTPTDGAALSVKDGNTKLTSPYSYDFGLATAGMTKTFTLSNPGTVDLSVSVSETGNFGATLSSNTIAAGGETTLTVTMPNATGSSTVTITPDAEGIDPFVINVSGTIRDANKLYEKGFTALPEDWTTTGTWYYNADNGAYTTVWYLTNNARLVTPLVKVSEGETFLVEAKGYSTSNTSYQHLQMQYSADGTNWTNFDSEPTLDPSSWNTYSFTGVPAGNYYIAINASQADIRMFYGGELPQVAKMVVNASDYNFGLIDSEATTTFTISNTGRAELTGIQVTSSNVAFTIEGAPTSLAVGDESTVTVKMSAANTGEFNGIITVKADDQEDVTFNVSGVVLPEGLSVVDFEDNKLPNSWELVSSNKWSFENGKAYATSAAEMVTSKIEVAEGDMVAIMATSYDDYDNNYLEIYTSSDNGSNWTLFKKFVSRSQIPYGTYAPLILSNIPTSTNMLKFKGYYVRIEEIRGLNFDQNAPALTVDPATAAEFGSVKAQPEAKTYTITNSGTGTLEGTIASDNEAFTVSASEFTLAAGESMTFDIALVFDENYGEKSANITITPSNEGLEAVTIAATATTKDPNVWEEDFESGSIPSEWTNNGWTCSNSGYGNNGTYMASAGNSNDNTLVTPRLKAEEGQQLTFDISGPDSTDPLTIQYSSDGENWIDMDGSPFTAAGTTTFTAPSSGTYYLKFNGKYSSVDNFSGFQLDLLAADFMITASNLPTTGKQYATYEASVTVKNTGTEAQTAVAKLYFGTEEVDGQEAELAVDGEAVITLTYRPLDAVTFDEVSIEVALKDVADVEVKTVSVQNVEIVAIPQLSEDGWTYDESTDYSTSGLQYSAKAGWNTIALPFAATADHLKKIFGENYKVYYCSGYSNGELNFRIAPYCRAGVPFIVYAESIDRDVDDLVVLENISITATEPSTDDAPFYGTYAPMRMTGKYGVVPSTGKIAKGGVNASLKGFRGYFELPAGAAGAKINFYDENDNLVNAIDAVELNNVINGNLYDLSGRKVEGKAKAGVYIQNGKKVVVK